MTPEWATGISLLALVISIGSALATWWAPQIAARVAEGLRSAAARTDLKRQVFLTLMQQRAVPFTEEAVQAFNIIDVVFVDAPSVREKWAVYYNSMDGSRQVPPAMAHQQLTDLLAAMAADIGLTGIGVTDLTRSYSPQYVMRRINIETMSQAIQEQELQRTFSQASANTTPQASSKP
jgi:Family of unknown function (DUF6680)